MNVDASAPMPIARIAPLLAIGFVVHAHDPPEELGEPDDEEIAEPIEIGALPLTSTFTSSTPFSAERQPGRLEPTSTYLPSQNSAPRSHCPVHFSRIEAMH